MCNCLNAQSPLVKLQSGLKQIDYGEKYDKLDIKTLNAVRYFLHLIDVFLRTWYLCHMHIQILIFPSTILDMDNLHFIIVTI